MGGVVSGQQVSSWEALQSLLGSGDYSERQQRSEQQAREELRTLLRLLRDSEVGTAPAVIRALEEVGIPTTFLQGDENSAECDSVCPSQSSVSTLLKICQLLNDVIGRNFVDAEFPPLPRSVGIDKLLDKDMTWKRLSQLKSSCGGELFPGQEPSCHSVMQSSHLGNCYFIAALSVLAERPNFLRRLFSNHVVPGRWVIHLHHERVWREVVVDDFFPVNPSTDNLVFGRNRSGFGSWVCLLEKAYAKLYGSYGAIDGGDIAEGLRDVSGSPVITLKFDHGDGLEMANNGALWKYILSKALAGNLLACGWCGNINETNAFIQKQQQMGGEKIDMKVIPNHAYAILKCEVKNGKRMLKIRNPWGKAGNDACINSNENLGCTWVAFEFWIKNFNTLYVCVLLHTSQLDENPSLLESSSAVNLRGEWVGICAGGCSENVSWRKNPQYTLTVPCTGVLYLTLSQPDQRKRRNNNTLESTQIDYFQIGIEIVIMLEGSEQPDLVGEKYKTLFKTSYFNKRDVSIELIITSDLVNIPLTVVPSTFFPHQEGHFTLCAEWNEDTLLSNKRQCSSISLTQRCFGILGSVPLNDKTACVLKSRGCDLVYKKVPCSAFDYCYAVNGLWTQETNGGAPHTSNFYKNPQYTIIVSCPTAIVLFLTQLEEKGKVVNNRIKDNSKDKKNYIGIGASCYNNVECLRNANDIETMCQNHQIGDPVLRKAREISKAIRVDITHNPILFVPCTEKGFSNSYQIEILSSCPISFEKAPSNKMKSKRVDNGTNVKLEKGDRPISVKSAAKKKRGVSFVKAKEELNLLSETYGAL